MTTIEPDSDGQAGVAGHTLPRRTLIAVGAWSVPVIALAAASPAMAASTPAEVTMETPSVFDLPPEDIPGTIPVVFSLAGVDEGAQATASLSGEGVVEWEDGGSAAIVAVEGGEAVFVVNVLAYGTFTLTLAVGSFSQPFVIQVVAA